MGMRVLSRLKNYLEVTKPRESVLLVFIGVYAALIASGEAIPGGEFLVITVAILAAAAGANGLTNYLDRDFDARMARTKNRVLPSGRIAPAWKALPWLFALVTCGLVLAWILNPYVFAADVLGTGAAVVWRKRWTCVFPQGMIASCAPVLMGWLAVSPVLSPTLLWLCLLICIWLPIHLWSVMLTHRADYQRAGITFYPMSRSPEAVTRVLAALSLGLYLFSLALSFIAGLGWLYLVFANLLGLTLVYAGVRLLWTGAGPASWRLYRLSAFPYLGLLFLGISLDVLLI